MVMTHGRGDLSREISGTANPHQGGHTAASRLRSVECATFLGLLRLDQNHALALSDRCAAIRCPTRISGALGNASDFREASGPN